jgi:hypothetical protein
MTAKSGRETVSGARKGGAPAGMDVVRLKLTA